MRLWGFVRGVGRRRRLGRGFSGVELYICG